MLAWAVTALAAAPLASREDGALSEGDEAPSTSIIESLSARNLVYIKVPRTGSDNTGSYVRRLAAEHGLSGYQEEGFPEEEPGLYANTRAMADIEKQVDGLQMKTFLFSVIREPVSRCLSSFYHTNLGRSDGPPVLQLGNSAVAKVHYMKHQCANFQFDFLKKEHQSGADEVWDTYDLLAAAPERLDESAVMLMKKYGHEADIGDVLYLNVDLERELQQSYPANYYPHPLLEDEPQEVQDYASGDFRKDSAKDFELFRRANQGIDHFLVDAENAVAVTEFKKLNERVNSECGEEKYCTLKDGQSADCKGCLWRDAGCGYECISKVLSEKKLLSSARRDRIGANVSNVSTASSSGAFHISAPYVSSHATTARRRRR